MRKALCTSIAQHSLQNFPNHRLFFLDDYLVVHLWTTTIDAKGMRCSWLIPGVFKQNARPHK
eukprot:3532242-Amphidinium_carterae.1